MATTFTEAETALIGACAAMDDDEGFQRLTEHFKPRGRLVLAAACQAVDQLRAIRAGETGGGPGVLQHVRELTPLPGGTRDA